MSDHGRAIVGAIGGSRSEEFQVLAASGEDAIAYCDADGFAANVEVVELPAPTDVRPSATQACESVATPGVGSIAALSEFLGVPAQRCLKTLLVKGVDTPAVALYRSAGFVETGVERVPLGDGKLYDELVLERDLS